MTLEQALEILMDWKDDASYPTLPHYVDALNLATQALDRIILLRTKLSIILYTHLRGEAHVDTI